MTSRFDDLRGGGRGLAAALRHHRAEGAVVLGIVRGGVPVAREVAAALDLPLDLVLLRALFQRGPGHFVVAARVAGTAVLDDESALHEGSPSSVEAIFVAEALEALARRETTCRGARPVLDLAGRTIVLVDNGMRTGTTMGGAIRAVRRLKPARIVAAAPVAAREALPVAAALADEVVCLGTPEPFGNVAMCYARFDVPADGQIQEFLG